MVNWKLEQILYDTYVFYNKISIKSKENNFIT